MAPKAPNHRSPEPSPEGAAAAAKRALRGELLAARRSVGVAELGARARAVADLLLATPEVRRAATVAAYVSVGSEPGTGPLLDRLADAGARVLLPVLRPDFDLDWAVHDGDLTSARFGLLEPGGPRLGVDAVAEADVVVVPGLAVDETGLRMGRGGGSYDRTLSRARGWTVVVLHDDEVVDEVPGEAHDRRVDAAVTERRLLRF